MYRILGWVPLPFCIELNGEICEAKRKQLASSTKERKNDVEQGYHSDCGPPTSPCLAPRIETAGFLSSKCNHTQKKKKRKNDQYL